ncbi:MAG: AMIN domain-containing protein [Kamptonema sp. SIO4C4]|nr:AMIN domain-containing protein [Kamptonema sp. SIO4C4]
MQTNQNYDNCRMMRSLPWRVSLGSAIASVLLLAQTTWGAILTQWSYNETLQRLDITLDASTLPNSQVLDNPPRIVVDFPDTTVGNIEQQQNYTGVVREVRVSQLQEDVTRVVLELSPQVQLSAQPVRLQRVATSTTAVKWIIHPQIENMGNPTPTPSPEVETNTTPLPPPQTNPVPVIDFGDPLPINQ